MSCSTREFQKWLLLLLLLIQAPSCANLSGRIVTRNTRSARSKVPRRLVGEQTQSVSVRTVSDLERDTVFTACPPISQPDDLFSPLWETEAPWRTALAIGAADDAAAEAAIAELNDEPAVLLGTLLESEPSPPTLPLDTSSQAMPAALEWQPSPYESVREPQTWAYQPETPVLPLTIYERPPATRSHQPANVWELLWEDQLSFYSADRMIELGGFVGAGAVLANTSADRNFRNFWHENVSGTKVDDYGEFFHLNKEFGNGIITLPLFAAAYFAGRLAPDGSVTGPVGNWGGQSLRIFATGAVPLVVLQSVTGGSRPLETPEDSEWHPFQDNNGVSGHAFMGAIPFLAAANVTENPWAKVGWLAASTLTGLSRVSDDHHYLSQAVMGWGIAFVSSRAVRDVDLRFGERGTLSLSPWATPAGHGMAATLRW